MRRTKWMSLPLLLVVPLLLMAAPAGAGTRLTYAVAKNSTKHSANQVCSTMPDCYRTRVPKCTRRSPRRLDCLALFDFREGFTCSMVVVNRLDRYGVLYETPKAVRCS